VHLSVNFFGQDGWILAHSFFGFFINLDSILLHKKAQKKRKKELGQYPAILTSSYASSIIHF